MGYAPTLTLPRRGRDFLFFPQLAEGWGAFCSGDGVRPHPNPPPEGEGIFCFFRSLSKDGGLSV